MATLFVSDITPEQAKNARKWIDALRSGEYKQTKGRLRRNDRYCCLGVACDVLGKEWDDAALKDWYLKTNETNLLGLRTGYGRLDLRDYGQTDLADLNDVKRWDFARIADVIEEELALVVEVTA